MFRHVLPNILAPTFVLASYYVAVAIIAEAALSFIGLGAQPPLPSLGVMVAEGRNYLQVNHWEATIPGITIVLMVLSVSLIGDGLRDVFDPRLRHEAKSDGVMRRMVSRTGYMIVILVLSSIAVFYAIRLSGGDATAAALPASTTAEQREAFRERLGLTAPIYVQYFSTPAGCSRGTSAIRSPTTPTSATCW